MNNLHEILEVCLQEVENGVELETVLARHPEQAEELRPILQASINARRMAVPAPSSEVLRRNRAKLLQRAAQMREGQPATTNGWFPAFQRLAVALVLLVLFFVSGTGLVRASSSALPGDSLYSVKRSWEDVTLMLTFDAEARKTLEIKFENERLEEINHLFASGRPANVDFAGIVTRQNGAGWRVANIFVIVSEQTDIPDQPVNVGTAVRVTGTTNGDGIVLAERIELLSTGAPLPEVKDVEPAIETEQLQVTPQPDNGNDAVSTPGTETPEFEELVTPSPEAAPKIELFESTLNSINNDVWIINNIPVNIANAEIKGIPVIGAIVKVEGYMGADGVFVAVKIEIINNGSSNNNDNGNVNVNSNSNGNTNTNSNDNTNTNSNDNTNTNDNGGNSNSGNDNGGGGGGGGGGNDNGG